MADFDRSKVHTEFREGVTKTAPILGRRYTLTHSDTTGELFVTVGRNFASDKFNEIRDEVILEFQACQGALVLIGRVLVDLNGDIESSGIRNEIFSEQMPLALRAIRYGDRCLYESCPELDRVSIWISFCSQYKPYSITRNYGTMKLYR